MPLYRILKPLSIKGGRMEPGCIENLGWSADKLNALEKVGAISRVASPPLSELPEWEGQAKQLLPAIVTVEDFLLADADALAAALQMDAADMEAVKAAARAWLSAGTSGDKPCGCA